MKVITLRPEKTKRFWQKPKKVKKAKGLKASAALWFKDKEAYFNRLERE